MIGVQWIGFTCVYTKADLYLVFLPFITRTKFQWTRTLKNHRPQLTTHPKGKKIPAGNLTNTYLKQLCLKGNTLSNPLAPHLGHCQSNLSHHFWGVDSSNFVGVPVCSPKLGSVNAIYLQLSKMKAKQVIKAIEKNTSIHEWGTHLHGKDIQLQDKLTNDWSTKISTWEKKLLQEFECNQLSVYAFLKRFFASQPFRPSCIKGAVSQVGDHLRKEWGYGIQWSYDI